MRARFSAMAVLVLLLSAFSSLADDSLASLPIPKENWDFGNLVAPLMVKSLTYHAKKNEVRIVFEFRYNHAFTPRTTDLKSLDRTVQFALVDDENVTIGTLQSHRVEGEIHGRKGEAFRVFVALPEQETLSRTKRIVLR